MTSFWCNKYSNFYNKLYPNKIDEYQSKYFDILVWILEKLYFSQSFLVSSIAKLLNLIEKIIGIII